MRPEALGQGVYDYAAQAEPSLAESPLAPAAAAAVAAPLNERQLARRSAREGMRICAILLLLIFVCVRFKWLLGLLVAAARSWPGWFER